ncbi:uncharacterized protein LOC144727778 isoform X3 [Lampetra planeri]
MLEQERAAGGGRSRGETQAACTVSYTPPPTPSVSARVLLAFQVQQTLVGSVSATIARPPPPSPTHPVTRRVGAAAAPSHGRAGPPEEVIPRAPAGRATGPGPAMKVRALQRESAYRWFGELDPAGRLEFLCGLLDLLNPLELRFAAACLEELARKDQHSLRDAELRANSAAELLNGAAPGAGPGEATAAARSDLGDAAVRGRLLVSLALLRSDNREAANALYRTLGPPRDPGGNGAAQAGQVETQGLPQTRRGAVAGLAMLLPPRAALASGEAGARAGQELVLLYTMASNHPAFAFHHKQAFRLTLRELRRALRQARRGDRENSRKSDPDGEGVGVDREDHSSDGGPEGLERLLYKGSRDEANPSVSGVQQGPEPPSFTPFRLANNKECVLSPAPGQLTLPPCKNHSLQPAEPFTTSVHKTVPSAYVTHSTVSFMHSTKGGTAALKHVPITNVHCAGLVHPAAPSAYSFPRAPSVQSTAHTGLSIECLSNADTSPASSPAALAHSTLSVGNSVPVMSCVLSPQAVSPSPHATHSLFLHRYPPPSSQHLHPVALPGQPRSPRDDLSNHDVAAHPLRTTTSSPVRTGNSTVATAMTADWLLQRTGSSNSPLPQRQQPVQLPVAVWHGSESPAHALRLLPHAVSPAPPDRSVIDAELASQALAVQALNLHTWLKQIHLHKSYPALRHLSLSQVLNLSAEDVERMDSLTIRARNKLIHYIQREREEIEARTRAPQDAGSQGDLAPLEGRDFASDSSCAVEENEAVRRDTSWQVTTQVLPTQTHFHPVSIAMPFSPTVPPTFSAAALYSTMGVHPMPMVQAYDPSLTSYSGSAGVSYSLKPSEAIPVGAQFTASPNMSIATTNHMGSATPYNVAYYNSVHHPVPVNHLACNSPSVTASMHQPVGVATAFSPLHAPIVLPYNPTAASVPFCHASVGGVPVDAVASACSAPSSPTPPLHGPRLETRSGPSVVKNRPGPSGKTSHGNTKGAMKLDVVVAPVGLPAEVTPTLSSFRMGGTNMSTPMYATSSAVATSPYIFTASKVKSCSVTDSAAHPSCSPLHSCHSALAHREPSCAPGPVVTSSRTLAHGPSGVRSRRPATFSEGSSQTHADHQCNSLDGNSAPSSIKPPVSSSQSQFLIGINSSHVIQLNTQPTPYVNNDRMAVAPISAVNCHVSGATSANTQHLGSHPTTVTARSTCSPSLSGDRMEKSGPGAYEHHKASDDTAVCGTHKAPLERSVSAAYESWERAFDGDGRALSLELSDGNDSATNNPGEGRVYDPGAGAGTGEDVDDIEEAAQYDVVKPECYESGGGVAFVADESATYGPEESACYEIGEDVECGADLPSLAARSLSGCGMCGCNGSCSGSASSAEAGEPPLPPSIASAAFGYPNYYQNTMPPGNTYAFQHYTLSLGVSGSYLAPPRYGLQYPYYHPSPAGPQHQSMQAYGAMVPPPREMVGDGQQTGTVFVAGVVGPRHPASPPQHHKPPIPSCFNCGVSGHQAPECTQPSMDSNQPATFRFRYSTHTDGLDTVD